jgi:hypothetical protein
MKNVIYLIIVVAVIFLSYTMLMKDDTASEAIATPAESIDSEAENTPKPNPFSALISESADGAEVFIIEPLEGAVVKSPFTVKFGIRNMTVAKAGDQTEFSGHHHLLINLDELPNLSAPIPATDQIIHFGGAQTETSIALSPGKHTLQLLLGNYAHIPHNKPILSKKLNVTVD